MIINYPQTYLKSLTSSAAYFIPSSSDHFIELNPGYKNIKKFDRYFNAIFSGQVKAGDIGVFLLVGFPVLVTYGIVVLFKSLRAGSRDLPFLLTILFILVNIVYVSLVTTLISVLDYNRYRFKVDAFYVMILGLLLTDGWRRLKHVISGKTD